jgi:hypothetical protein
MKARVWLRSAPGMWARYDGYVDVFINSIEEAFKAAVRQLARTSFPDRPSMSSWELDRIEIKEA